MLYDYVNKGGVNMGKRIVVALGAMHFGKSLPEQMAAVEFATSAPGRSALITLLEKAGEGLVGITGTWITSQLSV